MSKVEGDPLRALLEAAESADEKQLLRVATESLVTLAGEHGWCVLVEPEPRIVFSTKTALTNGERIELSRHPEIGRALDGGAPITVDNLRLVVPLAAGSTHLGAIIAERESASPATAELLDCAALLGQLTVRLVELARLRLRLQPTRPMRRLDRDPTPICRPRRATRKTDPERSRQRRILIVDDDPQLASITAEILTEEGYRTEIAHDSTACLRMARVARPDLILLDVMLPGADGFAVAQQLSEDPLTAQTPLLFLSGTRDLNDRVQHLKLVGSDFLAKPFSRNDLVARVALSLRQLDAREQQLRAAHIDELTGLGNVRHLQSKLGLEQARSERYGTSLALLMIDVDKLKRTNDEHGHLAGSELLATVGDILLEGVRETDVAVRYGGDEFVVLLPHTSLSEAMNFAERLLSKIRQARPAGLSFSVSVGAAAREGVTEALLSRLFEEADAAVYRAKYIGGDRACAYDPLLTGRSDSTGKAQPLQG